MRRASAACLLAVVALAWPCTGAAQPPVLIDRLQATQPALEADDARRVRQDLDKLLREHPPSVRTVLQADPALAQRDEYLASYPRLAAFLKAHPEIARNPGFFFGSSGFGYYQDERTPQERLVSAMQEVLAGAAAFIVALTVILVVGALVRQAFAHRRWLRQSRVQTEVHTKIVDRLQSNDELLAYIQTPAGQRFLEAGPSPRREAEPRTIGAPYGRILWSLQAGVMLMALGIGLWLVQRNAMAEIAPVFGALGTVAVVLGIGAVASAGLSFALSARLGLLQAPRD